MKASWTEFEVRTYFSEDERAACESYLHTDHAQLEGNMRGQQSPQKNAGDDAAR